MHALGWIVQVSVNGYPVLGLCFFFPSHDNYHYALIKLKRRGVFEMLCTELSIYQVSR